MKSWLYKFLNDDTKRWWAHQDPSSRPAQRRSIKDNVRMIRHLLACPGAHAMLSYSGEVSMTYQPWPVKRTYLPSGGYATDGVTSASGYSGQWIPVLVALGVPVIDNTTADFDELCDVAIKGPLVAVGDTEVTGTAERPGPFSYRPLPEVAKLYAAAGSTLFNVPPVGWDRVDTSTEDTP